MFSFIKAKTLTVLLELWHWDARRCYKICPGWVGSIKQIKFLKKGSKVKTHDDQFKFKMIGFFRSKELVSREPNGLFFKKTEITIIKFTQKMTISELDTSQKKD